MDASARARVAGGLRMQAAACRALGSPLYEALLEEGARDAEEGGPAWAVLTGHEDDDPAWALSVRLMAAVHRLVLEGRLPDLARHYPSAGGREGIGGAWPRFRAALESYREELRRLVRRPAQTNEVARSAALLGGFLLVARGFGLPLRLLEIGAAAGLNLLWDRYRYEGGGAAWGDPGSPVRFADAFVGATPPLATPVAVAERAGCDAAPVDPRSEDGRLTLTSFVWADQVDRLERLRGALEVARDIPVAVERADACEWLAARLARPVPGVATVAFHSVVVQYLGAAGRERLHRLLEEAGRRASGDAPLAWLRFEPENVDAGVGEFRVELTLWPPGEGRVVATAPPHGLPVAWRGW